MGTFDETLDRLVTAAARLGRRPAEERAELVAGTARSVAMTADAWAKAGADIEIPEIPSTGGLETEREARLAEEIATGPLATLRLLRLTEAALGDIARDGVPRIGGATLVHGASREEGASRIVVPVCPARGLADPVIFGGFSAAVRCADPGGVERFHSIHREEARVRPSSGGVAVVLGAGNVTGLPAADALCQIFEHGRAVLLKLHPIHSPLAGILAEALAPLVAEDLLAIIVGDAAVAAQAIAAPQVSQVHLTGGLAAYDAVARSTSKPITCELGSVTPWIVVPGDYRPHELDFQADAIAGSIINNASFNCIATKLVVTARGWPQREAFLARIRDRLARTPPRFGWYPGAAASWERLAGTPSPADGTLPWVFRESLDRRSEAWWIDREWFVPACAETALDGDDTEAFCVEAAHLAAALPGSLAASVTIPGRGDPRDRLRAEALVEHLRYGVVAVNCWSALAYSFGNVPWGGFPGGIRDEPKSGIGFVHDPLLLPLVHNSIVRGPLSTGLMPAWLPWHPRAAALARELVRFYGGGGLVSILRMLPSLRRG